MKRKTPKTLAADSLTLRNLTRHVVTPPSRKHQDKRKAASRKACRKKISY